MTLTDGLTFIEGTHLSLLAGVSKQRPRVEPGPAAAGHGSKAVAPAAVRIRGPSARDRDGVLEVAESELVLGRDRPVVVVQDDPAPPAVIIGSIASVIPRVSSGPRPGATKFGICGSS